MNARDFLRLPAEEVARLVQAAGSHVCAFPINGTRRWYWLEYPAEAAAGSSEHYLRASAQRLVEVYQLFFDHGFQTLLVPVFGPDLLARGDDYMQSVVGQGLRWFARDEPLWDLCRAYEVRVRVYGDARRYLCGTAYARDLEAFEEAAETHTGGCSRRRLFFGVCAHDPTERVAEIGAEFFRLHGRVPSRREVVKAYYGEYVEPVSLFIGFERPAAFDMPLLATGNEDLYFTVCPSLSIDAPTLRAILYDHLFARRIDESDYSALHSDDWQLLADFYRLNRGHVLGLGFAWGQQHVWCPLPQVTLPARLAAMAAAQVGDP
jgi:hypothetical protein